MPAIITKDIVNQRLRDKGKNIILIGSYTKQKNKSLFRCEECYYEWEATPDNVIRRSGCPICANVSNAEYFTSSKEEFGEYLLSNNRKLILVGEYTKSWNKSLFQCDVCDHQWMAKPNNIKNGKGCPKCAKYGFNPGKPAWGYVFERNNYIKYGITNNLEQRLNIHRRYGEIILHYSEYHEKGIDAKYWETNIKNSFGGNFVTKDKCPSGWTETLSLDHLKEITRRR
jgi:hypothetical protein